MQTRSQIHRKRKKPLYKKWWLWLVVVLAVMFVVGGIGSMSSDTDQTSSDVKIIQSKSKTGSIVGEAKYTIISIKQEHVKKDEDNYTDAEYNFSDIKNYPSKYYRTTLNYNLKNVGDKKFDLGYTTANIVDAHGQQYTDESNSNYGLDDNSGSKVAPGNKISAEFILLSKKPIDLKTYTIELSGQYLNGDTKVGTGGTVKF